MPYPLTFTIRRVLRHPMDVDACRNHVREELVMGGFEVEQDADGRITFSHHGIRSMTDSYLTLADEGELHLTQRGDGRLVVQVKARVALWLLLIIAAIGASALVVSRSSSDWVLSIGFVLGFSALYYFATRVAWESALLRLDRPTVVDHDDGPRLPRFTLGDDS